MQPIVSLNEIGLVVDIDPDETVYVKFSGFNIYIKFG